MVILSRFKRLVETALEIFRVMCSLFCTPSILLYSLCTYFLAT